MRRDKVSAQGLAPTVDRRQPVARPADAPVLLEQLAKIPDETRLFTMTAADAYRLYRITGELLDALVANGLPGRYSDGELRFEETDLINVALHLGCGPMAQAASRFWAVALDREPGAAPLRHTVGYQVACPDPGHDPPCRYTASVPGDRIVRCTVTGEPSSTIAEVEVAPDNDWPDLPEPVRELLDEARGLLFMRLPEVLCRDLSFIRRTGLCDCAGTTVLLLTEAGRRGITVRESYGFIVVPPFSSAHSWAEVLVDGRWVPVDPVLIATMVRWGLLPATTWTSYRSPGAILARVGDGCATLATHNGIPVTAALATRRLPDRPRTERR